MASVNLVAPRTSKYVKTLTQSEYNALSSKDANAIYAIRDTANAWAIGDTLIARYINAMYDGATGNRIQKILCNKKTYWGNNGVFTPEHIPYESEEGRGTDSSSKLGVVREKTTYKVMSMYDYYNTSGTAKITVDPLVYYFLYHHYFTCHLRANNPESSKGSVSINGTVGDYTFSSAFLMPWAGTEPVASFSTPRWIFQGYYTASSGGTKRYDSSGKVVAPTQTCTSAYDLYAQWLIRRMDLVLYASLDSSWNPEYSDRPGSRTQVTEENFLTYGDQIPPGCGTYSIDTKRWLFVGFWNTTWDSSNPRTHTGTKYYDADGNRVYTSEYNRTSALTLYAHWEPGTVDITWYPNSIWSEQWTDKDTYIIGENYGELPDPGINYNHEPIGWKNNSTTLSPTTKVSESITNWTMDWKEYFWKGFFKNGSYGVTDFVIGKNASLYVWQSGSTFVNVYDNVVSEFLAEYPWGTGHPNNTAYKLSSITCCCNAMWVKIVNEYVHIDKELPISDFRGTHWDSSGIDNTLILAEYDYSSSDSKPPDQRWIIYRVANKTGGGKVITEVSKSSTINKNPFGLVNYAGVTETSFRMYRYGSYPEVYVYKSGATEPVGWVSTNKDCPLIRFVNNSGPEGTDENGNLLLIPNSEFKTVTGLDVGNFVAPSDKHEKYQIRSASSNYSDIWGYAGVYPLPDDPSEEVVDIIPIDL